MRESAFLKACRREPAPYTPIWLMRQIGRYLPEYRALRAGVTFLEFCKRPDLVCESTVVTVEKLGVDAAIIFADILLITEPMGFRLEFIEGQGPVIHNPFKDGHDLARIRDCSPTDSLSFVTDAIRLARRALKPEIPLIGFAGAPFTVASYLIEGGRSKDFERTKSLMRTEPATWHALLSKIVQNTIAYLKAQISAGAQAVQLFDSWVGQLTAEEMRAYVLPHTQSVFHEIPKSVPAIYFGTRTGHLLNEMKQTGAGVIGLGSDVQLNDAWDRLGSVAVQGNLDPEVLFLSCKDVEREAQQVLDYAGGRPGHIFNLGHGVLPKTPVDRVLRLIEFVHERSVR